MGQNEVISYLKKHPGKWITSRMIKKEIKDGSQSNVTKQMKQISKYINKIEIKTDVLRTYDPSYRNAERGFLIRYNE